MEFIPNTILLNNIYIPFFTNSVKKVFNCLNDFDQLEIGFNGVTSTISLSKQNEEEYQQIIPFINMSKYDAETKDWFWYDTNNFPFRLEYIDGTSWKLNSVWEFGEYYGHNLSFNPKKLCNGSIESGFYSELTGYDDEAFLGVKFYSGRPIMITINEKILTDVTQYGNTENIPTLTQLNTETNKEFYFDPDTNKIYTNQNLLGVDPAQIKIYFETIPNSISVKCRMMSNYGENSYSTPTVDYYLVKLNGQYLRG